MVRTKLGKWLGEEPHIVWPVDGRSSRLRRRVLLVQRCVLLVQRSLQGTAYNRWIFKATSSYALRRYSKQQAQTMFVSYLITEQGKKVVNKVSETASRS